MHRKGAQDAKRAKQFTKLLHAVSVAAKSGDNPQTNTALSSAIKAAQKNNVPKSRIEQAIKNVQSKNEGDYMMYGATGPDGIAMLIGILTDNKNRTASELRSALSKRNFTMQIPESVYFLFSQYQILSYEGSYKDTISEIFPDVVVEDDICRVFCIQDDVESALEILSDCGQPISERIWIASEKKVISEEKYTVIQMIEEEVEENIGGMLWHNAMQE